MRRYIKAKDAVYLGKFEGWYDEGQEEYYTEFKVRHCSLTRRHTP
jgi:methionyl-tRNA synthetase